VKTFILTVALAGSLVGFAQAAEPLSAPALEKLHSVAAKCDADNSGVPDADTCVPTYSRLIAHYGGYEAFVQASRAWKAQRG